MTEKNLKAWEFALHELMNANPRLQTEEEKKWVDDFFDIAKLKLDNHRRHWRAEVPGSRAPDYIVNGAVQAMFNKGRDVSEAEEILPKLKEAFENNDDVNFLKYKAMVYDALRRAPKIEGHKYFTYKVYNSFEDHLNEVEFPEKVEINLSEDEFFEKQHAGWLAQISAAAIGTMLEGYSTEKIREAYGEVDYYLRKPSTQNDDILYELAFLDTIKINGKELTTHDIALEWLSKVDYAWSAEEAAIRNLHMGLFPPESATVCNFWNEWIGAQMRGAVCGMVAPGDPKYAAELAWKDGAVSHINNGILGEAFNAMLVSNAFIYESVRDNLKTTIDLIPKESEYYSVIKFALDQCEKFDNWEEAWEVCQEEYKTYNWIHTYPNAAAEIIALYYAEEDFNECMHIIAMCGYDVDCNAGQIGTIYGIMHGYDGIEEKWTEPFDDKFQSLYKGFEDTTITHIAERTVEAYKILNK